VAALIAGDTRRVAWIDVEHDHDDASVLLADLIAALTAVTDFRNDGLDITGRLILAAAA
jgi:hypothetical protein